MIGTERFAVGGCPSIVCDGNAFDNHTDRDVVGQKEKKILSVIKNVVLLQPISDREIIQFVRGVAQLASALAWGARGRKFESFRPDKRKKSTSSDVDFFFFYANQ